MSIVNNIADFIDVTPNDIINIWNDNYFKEQLDKNGLTIAELAEKTHKHKSVFYKYKIGDFNPAVDAARDICRILNCDINKLINTPFDNSYKLYNDLENNDSKSIDKDTIDNSFSENEMLQIPNEIIHKEYKRFENQNVVNNMEIINNNIIELSAEFYNMYMGLYNQLKDVIDINTGLQEKINNLEDKLDKMSNQIMNNISYPIPEFNIDNKNNKIYGEVTVWGNNTCTDKELGDITSSNVSEDDYDQYKKKIYKLIAYVAKKKNLIFNQILHDNYNKFSRIYGFDLDSLKKNANVNTVIEGIYSDAVCREIFFNMVCDDAIEEYVND